MKKFLVILTACVIVIFILALVGERSVPSTPASGEKKLSVVATFYPLAEFARAVGGDNVTVTSIVPAGAEPHEYEPTPQDILAAYQADVFLLNGAGIDPWAEKIRSDLEANGVTVIMMAEHVDLLSPAETGNRPDPHFWLDPLLAEREVSAIAEALALRDGAHREVYATHAQMYNKKLATMDSLYRKGLAKCALRTIVTTHAAFAYLAHEYGLTVLPLTGLSPEAEPTARTLTDIAVTIREQNIRYIFFESLVSPKVAEALAREVGAETLVFNPLEGLTTVEQAAGMDYFGVMMNNLDNLKTALLCRK